MATFNLIDNLKGILNEQVGMVQGNFLVGEQKGTINPDVLGDIVDEMNKQSDTIKFPLGGGYGDVTMTKI